MTVRPHGPRRYAVRGDAFDIVGASEAYWLGFLFADGSISKTGVIQLRITAGDAAHVRKFQRFMGSEHRIIYMPSETVAGYVCKPSVKLTLFSRRLGKRIHQLGRYEGGLALSPRRTATVHE